MTENVILYYIRGFTNVISRDMSHVMAKNTQICDILKGTIHNIDKILLRKCEKSF